MEIFIIILLAIVLAVLVGFFIWDRLRQERRWREQGNALSKTVGDSLQGSMGVFGDLRERLGELTTRTKNIEEVGKSISQLNQTLQAPQSRGRFGEVSLDTLLRDHFPYSYKAQHRFKNGKIVDFVLQVGERLVPIDSKFVQSQDFEGMVNTTSDEDRRRLRRQLISNLRRHVDAVREYIQPDEDTFDFALMFLPGEGLYYEAVVRGETDGSESEFCKYCRSQRVFPVSPSTLHAYLQAIVLGLQGMQLARAAREMQGHLQRLQRDLTDFQREYRTLGSHIHNATTKYDDAGRKLARFEDKLKLTTDTSIDQLPEGKETADDAD